MNVLLIVIVALAVLNAVFVGLVILLRVVNGRRDKLLEARRSTWYPRLITLISDGSNLEDLRRQIDPGERRDVIVIAWNLSRRLRGVDRDRLRGFAAPLLDEITPDLEARSAETRARYLQMVSCLGGDEYEPAIAASLDDPSQLVSLVAARALCQPNGAEWIAEVLVRLHRYASWSHALTSSMLANVGMDAAPQMRAFAADERHPARDRAAVIRALELLRDAEAADIAAAQLTDDDPDLIAACLRLLAVVGRSEHAVAVRPFLADERFFVRAAAITVLGKLGGASDAGMIAALDHGGSPWVAIRSAYALADLHATDELASMVAEGGLAADAAIETLYGGAA